MNQRNTNDQPLIIFETETMAVLLLLILLAPAILAAEDYSKETLGYQVVLADAGQTCVDACAALGDTDYTCPFTTAYKTEAETDDTKSTAWKEQKITSYDYDTSTYVAIDSTDSINFRNFEEASKIVLDAEGIKCNKLRINGCPYAGIKSYTTATGHSNLVMTHECRFPGNNRNQWCDADDVDSADYDCESDYRRLCRCGSVKGQTTYVKCGSKEGWIYYDSGDTTKSKCFKSLAVQGSTVIPDNAVSDWSTASATCTALGGKLPMPYTEDELTWFKENILTLIPAGAGSMHVWFDMTDSAVENYWKMGDGTALFQLDRSATDRYTNANADYYVAGWNTNQPDNGGGTQHCGGPWYSAGWNWDDYQCYAAAFVVCEKTPTETTANDEDAEVANRKR